MNKINWKNNYIIKSFRSRPVLFALTFFISSLLTYEITSTYTKETYEKVTELQREKILSLETRVQTLKTEMLKMNTVVVEEFSEETGKLLKREKKTETEKNTKVETEKETKENLVEKEIRIEKEKKEVIRDIQKNHVFLGYGFDEDGDQVGGFGYMRTIGIFNLGIQIQSDEQFKDKSILGTFGISF